MDVTSPIANTDADETLRTRSDGKKLVASS